MSLSFLCQAVINRLVVFNKIEEQHDWLHTVFWTDEVHFILSVAVDTHNCKVRITETSHSFVEVPLQQHKVTVCYGFTADIVIGPFFSKKCQSRVFVTGQLYAALLQNNNISKL